MITLKRSSILSQFYFFFDRNSSTYKTDICSYVKGVLTGFLIWWAVAVAGALAILCAVNPWIWAFGIIVDDWTIYNTMVPPNPGIVEVLFGFCTLMGFLSWTVAAAVGLRRIESFKLFSKKRETIHSSKSKKQSAIKVWFRSLKEKTCLLVELQD